LFLVKLAACHGIPLLLGTAWIALIAVAIVTAA
jgi:hypothetical protein